jgi:hypothetical protein
MTPDQIYREHINERRRARRAAETPEEREARLAKKRAYDRARAAERNARRAERRREIIETETPLERLARIEKERAQAARQRAKRTPEQREKIRVYQAEYRAKRKATETPEEYQARRDRANLRRRIRRAMKGRED